MKYFGEATKEIVKENRKLEYIRCDKCKKKINDDMLFYDVTTHHHDWGNDSIDSYVRMQICPDCIIKFTQQYLERAKGTEEIEIERRTYFYTNENYDEDDDLLVENDTKE